MRQPFSTINPQGNLDDHSTPASLNSRHFEKGSPIYLSRQPWDVFFLRQPPLYLLRTMSPEMKLQTPRMLSLSRRRYLKQEGKGNGSYMQVSPAGASGTSSWTSSTMHHSVRIMLSNSYFYAFRGPQQLQSAIWILNCRFHVARSISLFCIIILYY
ncbi:Protein of unknown function [Pyronema omphalodes CBS 100304]|uniref:Uncharacterized protein n=1 Tax=Pyronema omphalodes (strain CBS 100304) TaxID=1076935 RepID=U4L4S3_PYROM|nr:Protein of unknown function [Pyronema omphalodes CBS 100304]